MRVHLHGNSLQRIPRGTKNPSYQKFPITSYTAYAEFTVRVFFTMSFHCLHVCTYIRMCLSMAYTRTHMLCMCMHVNWYKCVYCVVTAVHSHMCGHCCTQPHVWLLLYTATCVVTAVHSHMCGHCCTQPHVWSLLYTATCVVTAVHSHMCGHCCTQPHVWSLLYTATCVVTAVHSHMCGHCCTQPHVWSLLYTATCVVTAVHSHMCGHCCTQPHVLTYSKKILCSS